MSFVITEHVEGQVIEIQITGKLSKQAYEQFVPMTEAKIEEFGKVRMLVVLHHFHGWEAGALWEDIKFDLKNFNRIERLAIVGDSKWEQGMAMFCRPFTTAKIKYFEHTDIATAREWIQGDQ